MPSSDRRGSPASSAFGSLAISGRSSAPLWPSKDSCAGRDSIDAVRTRLWPVGRAEPYRHPAADRGGRVGGCCTPAARLVVATQDQNRLAIGASAAGGGSRLPAVGHHRVVSMGQQLLRLLYLLVGPAWSAHRAGDHPEQRGRRKQRTSSAGAARRWRSGVDRPGSLARQHPQGAGASARVQANPSSRRQPSQC
jgi:hypothetical protein